MISKLFSWLAACIAWLLFWTIPVVFFVVILCVLAYSLQEVSLESLVEAFFQAWLLASFIFFLIGISVPGDRNRWFWKVMGPFTWLCKEWKADTKRVNS